MGRAHRLGQKNTAERFLTFNSPILQLFYDGKPKGSVDWKVVKLRYRIIDRNYKGNTYTHSECALNFPVELHYLLKLFWNRNVKLEITIEGDTVHIIMREDQEK